MGFLSKNKPLVGLDIGTSGVKAVELTRLKKGYELTGFAYESLGPDAVVDGAIMDARAVAESIRRKTYVNNTITTQFVTFALQLDLTPQISAAGTILMQVNVPNSQPDFARAVGGIPSVASQSPKTLVMVPDGATAVIGGILVDTDFINIRQVPGLGNLPLIGTLFKETNTAKSTSELLFFITPRIKPIDAISVLARATRILPSSRNGAEQAAC
jgi:Flp pilus assembly secretin CpaC